MSVSDRRKFYEQQLEQKRKDLVSVSQDLAGKNTQEDVRRLNNRAEQLLSEIEDYEQKLSNCGGIQEKFRATNNYWEQKLKEIDYNKAKKIIEKSIPPNEERCSSSLFLMQRNEEYCGNYCIEHLREHLGKCGTLDRPYIIGFSSFESPCPDSFLRKLGEELLVEISNVREKDTELVINALCKSLRQCNILFLQVALVVVENNDTFLDWFIQDLWEPLDRRLPELSKHNPCINLVGVLSVESVIPRGIPRSGEDKMLRLPQEKWKESDILRWLRKFSKSGKGDESFKKMSGSIFAVTQGSPYLVRKRLLTELTS